MLAAITGILRESRLLEPGDEPGYNLTFSGLHAFNIGAFTPSGAFYHVKLKKHGDLLWVYDNYYSAWQSFPEHAPEPLGRHFIGDWEVFVVRGIRHRPVSVGSIALNEHGLVRRIGGFFEASGKGARVAMPAEPHSAFLRRVQERATDPVCAAVAGEWISRIDELPHIRQHGDLVVNNLGWTGTGLIVFDWEDFGRITVPGLDLCTLVASEPAFDPRLLRAIIAGTDHPYVELVDRGCRAIGLPLELFRRLIPLYLAIFLDLKSEYGKPIGRLVSDALHELRPRAGAHAGPGRE